MASEDLFEEEFSEEVITELDQSSHGGIEGLVKNNQELKSSEANTEGVASVDEDDGSGKNKLSQLPLTRIRNLMKLDPDLHIASNEAVFVVTRATEEFVESLARESYFYTTQSKKKTVQKRDVDMAIAAVDSLMFLEGALF